jgi:hypothetical protein
MDTTHVDTSVYKQDAVRGTVNGVAALIGGSMWCRVPEGYTILETPDRYVGLRGPHGELLYLTWYELPEAAVVTVQRRPYPWER